MTLLSELTPNFNIHGFHTGTKYEIEVDGQLIADAHYEGYGLFGKAGQIFQHVSSYRITHDPQVNTPVDRESLSN